MAVAETLAVRVRSVARSGINPGAVALALAVPFLFLSFVADVASIASLRPIEPLQRVLWALWV